ncbi:hypothetical protein [Streptomyces cellulosae]|uniref:Uncharacterized protein n=1 Tax=Streptomyces cellulosae TaxID=1968 RepID=A0ABW7YEG7_STRCE
MSAADLSAPEGGWSPATSGTRCHVVADHGAALPASTAGGDHEAEVAEQRALTPVSAARPSTAPRREVPRACAADAIVAVPSTRGHGVERIGRDRLRPPEQGHVALLGAVRAGTVIVRDEISTPRRFPI